MEYKNIKYNKSSIIIVSFITLLSYITTVYFPLILGYNGIPFEIALPASVGLFLILDRFVYEISIKNERNQMKGIIKSFDENTDDLKSLLAQMKVIDNGTIITANEKIAKKIATADWVKNVFVNNPNNENYTAQRSVIVSAYEKWLENKSPGDWIDIVGIQELFSDRFQEIKPVHQHGNHKLYVLRHSTPTLNFLILGKDGKSEVFMGWLPEYKGSIDYYRIFSSRDKFSIKMFNRYFDYLMDRKTWNGKGNPYELDFQQKGERRYSKVPVVDKKGLWTTLGVDGGTENNLMVRTIGFVEVKIDADAVAVRAAVYDIDEGAPPDISNVPHEEIAHYKNDIYVGYELEDGTSGICHYRFKRDPLVGEYMVGTFVHKRTGLRTALIGIHSRYSSFDRVCTLSENEVKENVSAELALLRQKNLLKHFRGPVFHDRENS